MTRETRVDEEKPGRVLGGWPVRLVGTAAGAVGVLAVWQVFAPLSQGSQYYLMIFLGAVLPLVFLAYPSGLRCPGRGPGAARRGLRPTLTDWALAAASLAVCWYPVLPFVRGGYDAFLDRQGRLDPLDTLAGAVLLLVILEACRRTTGWALPAVCLVFLGYAYYGGLLPAAWPIAHSGLDFDQIVDTLYSGFYGTPLDVAASYIVLFTIYSPSTAAR